MYLPQLFCLTTTVEQKLKAKLPKAVRAFDATAMEFNLAGYSTKYAFVGTNIATARTTYIQHDPIKLNDCAEEVVSIGPE